MHTYRFSRIKQAFRALMALTISAGVLAGCATDRAIIDQANKVHGGIEPAVITDPQLNNYINLVGRRIIDAAKQMHNENYGPDAHRKEDSTWMFGEMKFHFVNSETLNAFTTGGEHMYIYSQLFRECTTEDELAAVMAHEYAHVYGRHVHKGMNRQYGLIGAAIGAGALGYAVGGDRGLEYGAAFAGATAAGGALFLKSYTRKDEDEADDLGFAFYTRAGWDPAKFGDFFQKMIDKGYDTTPEMMSDHPSLKNRVEATKKRAAALPPEAAQWRKEPVVNASVFKQLQNRAAEVAKTMPSDKTLEGAKVLLAAANSCFAPAGTPDQDNARRTIWGEPQK